MNALEKQIKKYKKEIHSDSYPMSIGEVISMYKDEELDIHPEFQRLFRWSTVQKSKFIESIFLGIPLPSFFVSQREDGIWDVIDGLQRLSTIFEFVGELKDEVGKKKQPLVLVKTKNGYLDELEGAMWNNDAPITPALKLDFKRSKIDFKIIKKESSPDTKYELFQRLNTGGSALSDQEVRNCLLLMINKQFYLWLQKLVENTYFTTSTPLSDNQIEQAYDMELVTRFIVLYHHQWSNERDIGDVGIFLNTQITEHAQNQSFDMKKYSALFNKTFEFISSALGEDAFRKYFPAEKKHKGPFSIALFEFVSVGLAKNINAYSIGNASDLKKFRKKVLELSSDQIFLRNSGSGVRGSTRIPKLMPYCINYFQ